MGSDRMVKNMAKRVAPVRLDEIGYWSEVKLDIVRKYAAAYSRILASKDFIKSHVYIDAFAGAGEHVSRATGQPVAGSPLNALEIQPPFSELHFIDLNGGRAANLRELTSNRSNVTVHEGDCNTVLIDDVFPQCCYEQYRRALCLLDPYKLNVDWRVIQTAGQMRSIEVFFNFMIMDANMNVLHRNPDGVSAAQQERMDGAWGDRSWRDVAYSSSQGLFDTIEEKNDNSVIAEAFRDRLKRVAGFKYVPPPMPMRNSRGAVVYYLYFAGPDATGAKIVEDIFDSHRTRGGR